jgi:formate hydrogenlyase subunit 4
MTHVVIHILVAALLPPLLLGVINKTKAAFAGRVGPPFLQPYFDLLRLIQKGSVFSTTTTSVFRLGPVVGLATAAVAAMLVPLGYHETPLHFQGDIIFLAYVLGLSRFFTMAAALDTGSAFEGMGAAREATFACLAEPVLFFGMLVLAKAAPPSMEHLSLSHLLGDSLTREWSLAGASMLLVLLSWFVVLLAENCRIPFDDPNTHLELTMIHEVMVLDHSGPAFGMILYGAALKLFVFGALVVRLAVPLDTAAWLQGTLPVAVYPWLNWSIFIAAMLALAALIGVVESVMARLRMPSVPALLIAAGVLSAFGIVLMIAAGNGS